MRLATITNWAYGVTVALTVASGITMLLASAAQTREREAVDQRYALDRATSSIDEDVAALSSLARQFAISGSAADLAAYEREASHLRSVEDRTRHVRDAGARYDELRNLRDSLRWADALRDEQEAAIVARQGGHRDAAVDILFSPEYERELDRIQVSVERFQDRIDQRTGQALQIAVGRSRLWRGASEAVLGVTGLLFLCVLFFIFRQRVLRPVVKLSDVVTRLAAQDFAAEPPAYEQIDEIGDMAQALRVFRDNGLARQRLEHDRDADRAIRDLLSRMTQRMQSCDTAHDLKAVVKRFVPEVAPQFAGRLYLLSPARNAMIEACSWHEPVHSRSEFAPLSCWALRRGSPHHASGNHVDIPCDHVDREDGGIPETLCLPLGSQHGTLGMLYFERKSDAGRSDMPDVYLKMLAENISLALDNLQLRDTLREMAMVDPLTGLANRRRLEIVLDEQVTTLRQDASPISCAMIDIDHFKRFNDDHGHDAGDAVLRAVGAALRQSIREQDFAFRYGGEEFLLLMPGLDASEGQRRAEDLCARIAALGVQHEGRALGSITASLGVAAAPLTCDYDNLVRSADAALLLAKNGGRNRVVVAQFRGSLKSAIQ